MSSPGRSSSQAMQLILQPADVRMNCVEIIPCLSNGEPWSTPDFAYALKRCAKFPNTSVVPEISDSWNLVSCPVSTNAWRGSINCRSVEISGMSLLCGWNDGPEYRWSEPIVRYTPPVPRQILERVEAVEMVNGDFGNRFGVGQSQIDRDPPASILAWRPRSPIRDASARGAEMKRDRLSPDVRPRRAGNRDAFVCVVISP